MPRPEPTTPNGVSRSDMRKALTMARMGILMVSLGLADTLSTGGTALAWRHGEGSVTFSLTAVLGYLVVVAGVFAFVESHRFLPVMVAIFGGVVLMVAALIAGVLLTMRPGPDMEVTPWALLGFTVVLFGIMQLMVLSSTWWLRCHHDGVGVKAVTGLVDAFVVAVSCWPSCSCSTLTARL